jgi:hypothetical protein
VAAEPIRFHVQLEVLYPVLPFSSARLELVEGLRGVALGGEDEARVRPLLHDFGLVEHLALFIATRCLVEIFAKEPRLATRLLVALFGLLEKLPGHIFEALIGYEGDGVGDALLLAVVVVDGRNSEAGVRSYLPLLSLCPLRAIFASFEKQCA